MDRWIRGDVSNFHYLMAINSYAGLLLISIEVFFFEKK